MMVIMDRSSWISKIKKETQLYIWQCLHVVIGSLRNCCKKEQIVFRSTLKTKMHYSWLRITNMNK